MDRLTLSLIGAGIFSAVQLLNSNKLQADSLHREENDQEEYITPGIALNEFTSNKYQLGFRYPKSWRKNPRYEEKYEGDSGFFEIMDFSGTGENIDQALQSEINESYKPFGSDPVVRSFVVDGQPVRVIYPSEDQPEYYKDRDAAIIVQYPQPVTIDNKKFDYAIIWATKEYIPLILSTLKFVQ